MTTHMPMAAARQPFAPVNSSRLQNLTSVKNRQNAAPCNPSSPGKRKATSFESDDDSENVAPISYSPKRSRAIDGVTKDNDPSIFTKPPSFFLTRAPPSPTEPSLTSPIKTKPSSLNRTILQAHSQTPKIRTTIQKSSPLSAPAGRSPTRKRCGILNRRKTGSPITRVDPPKFSNHGASGLSFSLDAALSGTIPSYGVRHRQSHSSSAAVAKTQTNEIEQAMPHSSGKSSWFFQIHEDTEEELATNLMEHSTCTLDISSDEESATRLRNRLDKENIPPSDDISQTRSFASSSSHLYRQSEVDAETEIREMKRKIKTQRRRRQELDEGAIDIDRSPLGEMRKEDFYAEGCDERSVFIILPDPAEVEDEVDAEVQAEEEEPRDVEQDSIDVSPIFESVSASLSDDPEDKELEPESDDFEVLMQKRAATPIEKPEENFVLWESGSANGEGEE